MRSSATVAFDCAAYNHAACGDACADESRGFDDEFALHFHFACNTSFDVEIGFTEHLAANGHRRADLLMSAMVSSCPSSFF